MWILRDGVSYDPDLILMFNSISIYIKSIGTYKYEINIVISV